MIGGLSLSHLGKLLLIVPALLLAGLVGWQFGPDLGQYLTSRSASEGRDLRQAQRFLVYRLDPDRATTVRFSQPVRLVRIVTHPVIAPGAVTPGRGWKYSVIAELLGLDGAVVARHEVWSRSVFLDAAGKPIGPFRFYRGSRQVVTLGDELRIAAPVPVAQMRLFKGRADPGVLAIDARAYERRPILESRLDATFVRFNPQEQADLARGNAFPVALLTPEEKHNLVRNQWRPLGPLGIEGRDYQSLVLYENIAEADTPGGGK